MSLNPIEAQLAAKVNELQQRGISKGQEKIIVGRQAASGGFGPRYLLQGYGSRAFLRMNSNNYLGLSTHPEVIRAEAETAEQFGAGPGAVRFISGSYRQHIELEQKLALFHGRESAILFSSAYTAMTGVLPQFITPDTLVVSDALNHNCIINAIRLSHPAVKEIYPHNDTAALESILKNYQGKVKRVCLVTDGIFSMRGDFAPLDRIAACCERYEAAFPEGIITVVDDSHGIGAFGPSGRGTEEHCAARADILIATLGKAFGVNGGYVVANRFVTDYLKETSPFYIYTNPITPAEAAAASAAVDIASGLEGGALLTKLRCFGGELRAGLERLGFETLAGEHPIVPVLIGNTERTSALTAHLFANDILATGLNYPVVPEGEQEIRLQVSAEHTEADLDYLLAKLAEFEQ